MIRALLICAGLLLSAAVFAQGAPPASQDPEPKAWSSLSPEQQQVLQNYQGKWSSLPAERQQALAKGSERWAAMTPEQRSGAQQRFQQWRAMPPEQRQVLMPKDWHRPEE